MNHRCYKNKNIFFRYAPDTGNNTRQQIWTELADSLLCDGLGAQEIKDELVSFLPANLWFVFVQPSTGSWASHNIDSSTGAQTHLVENLCGKNYWVWTFPKGGVEECTPETGDMAQKLVDDAIEFALGPLPSYRRDYMTMSMAFLTNLTYHNNKILVPIKVR